jgi:hypothetical protein
MTQPRISTEKRRSETRLSTLSELTEEEPRLFSQVGVKEQRQAQTKAHHKRKHTLEPVLYSPQKIVHSLGNTISKQKQDFTYRPRPLDMLYLTNQFTTKRFAEVPSPQNEP